MFNSTRSLVCSLLFFLVSTACQTKTELPSSPDVGVTHPNGYVMFGDIQVSPEIAGDSRLTFLNEKGLKKEDFRNVQGGSATPSGDDDSKDKFINLGCPFIDPSLTGGLAEHFVDKKSTLVAIAKKVFICDIPVFSRDGDKILGAILNADDIYMFNAQIEVYNNDKEFLFIVAKNLHLFGRSSVTIKRGIVAGQSVAIRLVAEKILGEGKLSLVSQTLDLK